MCLADHLGRHRGRSTPLPFFQGFETDASGWFSPTRVASGTHAVPSASGAWHAETAQGAGDFTRSGGYTDTFPPGGYTTSLDIYFA